MNRLTDEWRKSTRSSDNGACVEVRRAADGVEVRDSKNMAGPSLCFAAPRWTAFLDAVAHGEFDRS
jgi:hypothetical protein